MKGAHATEGDLFGLVRGVRITRSHTFHKTRKMQVSCQEWLLEEVLLLPRNSLPREMVQAQALETFTTELNKNSTSLRKNPTPAGSCTLLFQLGGFGFGEVG